MNDHKIIDLIKKGIHSKALNCLYKNYPGFKNKFIKSGGKTADADDIFQQGLLILIEKLSDENFNLKCSLNTLLFSICRNLSNEYFRLMGTKVQIDLKYDKVEEDIHIDEYIEQEKKYGALNIILKQIGERCMKVLTMFYCQGLSMIELSKKLGFKSETSAKTQKYKCLEKARELALEIIEIP